MPRGVYPRKNKNQAVNPMPVVQTNSTGVLDSLQQELKRVVDTAAQGVLNDYNTLLTANLEQIEKLAEEVKTVVKKGGTLHIEVGERTGKLKGMKHKQLEKLITIVAQNQPTLLVGMAGVGKTHAAEQVAQALDVPFYAISVGAQTSKSDIMGYMNAGGSYTSSLFRKAYEEGGVFLMDEIDAGNSNVLIQINAALSNNYCAFPDKMVKRHENFRFIASANTFGFGASRMYVGRNQLDAATLDRFTVLTWDIDEELEELLAGDSKVGTVWLKIVRHLRDMVQRESMRALITPRATIRGVTLLEAGMPFSEVLQVALVNNIPSDKQGRFTQEADNMWRSNGMTNQPNHEQRKRALDAEIYEPILTADF